MVIVVRSDIRLTGGTISSSGGGEEVRLSLEVNSIDLLDLKPCSISKDWDFTGFSLEHFVNLNSIKEGSYYHQINIVFIPPLGYRNLLN